MKVIKAKPGDIKCIMEMHTVFETDQYACLQKAAIAENIRKGQCYVAVEDGEIVGSIILEIDEGSCEIGPLVSKKKGGGTTLVQFAIDMCKKKNIPKLWCWSLRRLNAIGFYEKMGFEEAFLLKKQWFGEDCYIFGKVIRP